MAREFIRRILILNAPLSYATKFWLIQGATIVMVVQFLEGETICNKPKKLFGTERVASSKIQNLPETDKPVPPPTQWLMV